MTIDKRVKENRNILITGSSKGIGKAIKEELLLQGFHCISPTREELDINSKESIIKFFDTNKEPIFGLINNAGINIVGELGTIDDQSIMDMININLIGPLLLIQKVGKRMKEQKFGKIVNISSIWGVSSKEYRTLYSATKFGINGITKALSRELGPYNILVNSVAPGYVNTEMTKKNVPKEEQENIQGNIPLRRFAEPKEIAKVVAFLISDNNTYITGQIITADGGYLA